MPDSGETFGPEGFLDDVLDGVNEGDFSFDVVAPLSQDVPLLEHVVVVVHFVDDESNTLLKARIVHFLEFVDFIYLIV